VHVPVRIRLDAGLVEDDTDVLEARLDDALERALARSVDVAVARHAGPIAVHAPTFRWMGEAVEPAVRAKIEERLAGIVTSRAATLPAAGSGRLAGPVRERRGPRREVPGGYRIPSYQGDGGDEVITFSDEDTAATLEIFDTFETADESIDGLRRAIAYYSRLWPDAPVRENRGILFLGQNAGLQAWFVYRDVAHALWFGPSVAPVWNGRAFEWRPAPMPSPELSELSVVASFDPADVDSYTEALRDRFEAQFRRHLTVDADVAREIRTRAEALAKAGVRTAMELRIGDVSRWFGFPLGPEERFEGSVLLYPVTAWVRPPRGIGSGSGGTSSSHEAGGTPGGVEGGGEEGEDPAEELKFVAPIFQFDPDDPLVCESFLGEPDVDSLGAAGASLKQQIAALAARLQMEPCGYAGQFCLMAAQRIGTLVIGIGDAVAVSQDAAVTEYRRDGSGNLGSIEMRPRTVANALLARAAGAVPLITDLAEDVKATYRGRGDLLSGMYANQSSGWILHFLLEFEDPMRETLARMFGETCRILMLQLLDASRAHIENRQNQIDSLAHSFYGAVLPSLIGVAELITLKDRLAAAQAPPVSADPDGIGYAPVYHEAGVEYDDGDDAIAIIDARGRRWTMPQLQSAIGLRRGSVEELEPLVKHIEDLPRSVEAMRPSEAATKEELGRIFATMRSANQDVRDRVAWSWEDAFKYGPIDSDLPGETPAEIGRNLHGIHLLAHQELAPRIGASRHYAEGVRGLFEGEHALEIVESLLVLGILVVISVLCPPLGYVAGIAVAGLQYLEAVQRGEIRDALVNADQIVDLAELDVERFAAALGLALAVIPDAPALIRGAYRAGAAALEEGTITAAKRVILSQLRTAAIEGLERALARGMAQEIGKHFLQANVFNQIISRALQPALRARYAAAQEEETFGQARMAQALIAWSRQRQGGR